MPRMAPGFQTRDMDMTGGGNSGMAGGPTAPPAIPTGPAGGGAGGGLSSQFPTTINQPSFATRKANAQNLYGPGGPGMNANFPQSGGGGGMTGSGGGVTGGPPTGGPPDPRMQRRGPMTGGGGPFRPQIEPAEMAPPPGSMMRPQGGFSGANPMAGGLPPGLQQLLQQPGFMEMLMRYAGGGPTGAPQGGAPVGGAPTRPMFLPPNGGGRGPIY